MTARARRRAGLAAWWRVGTVACGVVGAGWSGSAAGQATVAGSAKVTEPAATPVVADLPEDLNARAQTLADARREIFAAFKAAGQAAEAEVAALGADPDTLADEAKRAAVAPRLVPALRRLAQLQAMRHDFGGRRNVSMLPSASSGPADGLTFVENAEWNAARLAALGDDEGARMLADYAGFDPALPGRMAAILRAGGAERAQEIAALGRRLQSRPFDDAACDEAILVVKRRVGSDADRAALRDVMEALVPECGQQLQVFVRALSSGEKFSRTERLVGTRDFKVKGTLLDGTPFDSLSLAGKVIVVDFWATWCGPCVAELPRLVELRERHKADGLEIIGVSNDHDREALQEFLKKHPEVAWPQLFDAASAENAEMHALARASGIQGIPALFVIDRTGTLRSVTARSSLETIVAELVAEPVGP